MADVAVLAGVSAMTVSRALRSGSSVSSETRARVSQAIDELGYIPDLTAGSLSSGHFGLIGYIVPDLHDLHFINIAEAIRRVMAGESCDVFMAASNRSPQRENDLVEMMLRRRVEAFVIAGSSRADRAAQKMRDAGVPIVDLLHGGSAPPEHSVTINPTKLAGAIISYLVERGRKRIALVTPSTGMDPAADARADALMAEGRRIGAEPFVLLEMDAPDIPITQGARAVDTLCVKRSGIDAIVCYSDLAAYGAVEQCGRIGIAVPDELAIMGFGNQEVAAFSRPAITSIAFNAHSIGVEVAKILTTCRTLAAQHVKPPNFRHEVDFEIVSRESA